MNRRSPRLSICLPLLASLALPASLAAQESSRPAEDQPSAERQTASSSEPGGRDSQPRDNSAATSGRTPDRDAILAEMRAAELEHRERVAAINRLRQLARDRGRSDRLAELDGVEASESARHQAALRTLAGRLGDAAAAPSSQSSGSTVCEGPTEKPARSGLAGSIRRVRTGARAAATPARAAESRERSTQPPSRGRQTGTATPSGTGNRAGGSRTTGTAVPPPRGGH